MTTLETLQALLAQQYKLDPGAIVPEATLETLGVDSLGLLELLFEIEDRFGIKVPTERPALQTIAEVAAYVDRLVAEQQGARPHVAGRSGTGVDTGGTDPGAAP